MAMTPAKQTRKARQYLRKNAKAGSKDINPRKFAAASKESGSFRATMDLIRYYYSSGDERAQLRRNQLNKL